MLGKYAYEESQRNEIHRTIRHIIEHAVIDKLQIFKTRN